MARALNCSILYMTFNSFKYCYYCKSEQSILNMTALYLVNSVLNKSCDDVFKLVDVKKLYILVKSWKIWVWECMFFKNNKQSGMNNIFESVFFYDVYY